MDENTIIEELEELTKTFGVQIRHEAIKQDEDLVNIVGGLCLVLGGSAWEGQVYFVDITTNIPV